MKFYASGLKYPIHKAPFDLGDVRSFWGHLLDFPQISRKVYFQNSTSQTVCLIPIQLLLKF